MTMNIIPSDVHLEKISVSPYVISWQHFPLRCSICNGIFGADEKALLLHNNIDPICLGCVTETALASDAYSEVIVVHANASQVAVGYVHVPVGYNASQMPIQCSKCGVVRNAEAICGYCLRTACILCRETHMHRCQYYCHYRHCPECPAEHNCPNVGVVVVSNS